MDVVIIDDEKNSRELLNQLLTEYCNGVRILGMAANVKDGIRLIQDTRPDLVFLDIELQSASGFELLEQLPEVSFEVIFTTAFEQYAIRAIKMNALDYLLKPIDLDDLKAALDKYVNKKNTHDGNKKIEQLLHSLKQKELSKITLSTSEGVYFIDVNDIIRCEAQGAYTRFYMTGAKQLLVSKNLKEYETLLAPNGFFRIHHSHLINLSAVERFIKSDGGTVVMSDGGQLPVSQQKREEFLEKMK